MIGRLIYSKKLVIIMIITVAMISLVTSCKRTELISSEAASQITEIVQTAQSTSQLSPAAEKNIYKMNVTDDEASEVVPNSGEVIISKCIKDFIVLELPDDYYIEVNIRIYMNYDMVDNTLVYNGKTITQWENDAIYDDYYSLWDEFKESEEYKNQPAKGGLEDIYDKYWCERHDDEAIDEAHKFLKEYANAFQALREWKNTDEYEEIIDGIIFDEYQRLLDEGLDLNLYDEYNNIKGILNRKEIENFPTGDFGYNIRLFADNNEPKDEG